MDSIKDVFNKLLVHHGSIKRDFYLVETIDQHSSTKVGFSPDGFPSLLISSGSEDKPFEPIQLSGLDAIFNLECSINIDEKVDHGTFHVITYTEEDIYLRDFFFEFFEEIFNTNENLSAELLKNNIEQLAQLFSYKKNKSLKSIQGLWAELFVINTSEDSTAWLKNWPEKTRSTFDFAVDHAGIDVKSFAGANRKHFFKYEQLHNQSVEQTIILSLCVTEDENGISVFDLYRKIKSKIHDPQLLEKLRKKIFKLAGDNLSDAFLFNANIAKETLVILEGKSIPKIQEGTFPSSVTEISFKSDCTDLPMLPFSQENQKQLLKGTLNFPDQ